MTTGIIVQARMQSVRFPGKTLHEIEGKPLIRYLLEQVYRMEHLCPVVIATSGDGSDDPIVNYCVRNNIAYHRGSLTNVAERFLNILQEYQLDSFVRLNGDSPFLDRRLVDKAVDLFEKSDFDVVTNVQNRTYPPGQSVEVLRSDVFCNTYKLFHDPHDLEHVTAYFYKHADNFKIQNFESGRDCNAVKLSVDTPGDMALVSSIIAKMDRPHWKYTWDDVVEMYKTVIVSERGA